MLPVAAQEGTSAVAEPQEIFTQAQQAFDEAGKLEASAPQESRDLYLKAYRRFSALAEEHPKNAAVYYNLGNTCFRLGRVGEAIANYKRALKLRPHDPNIVHNLGIARAQRKDTVSEEEETRILKTLLFWHYDISSGMRLNLFGVCFVLFWVGMIVRRLMQGKKWIPRWVLGALAVVWISLLTSLVVQPMMERSQLEGVVTSTEVTAREGNGENYKSCFTTPLHEGTEFTVFEQRPGWYGIVLQDGRQCWIPADTCEIITGG